MIDAELDNRLTRIEIRLDALKEERLDRARALTALANLLHAAEPFVERGTAYVKGSQYDMLDQAIQGARHVLVNI